MVSAYNKVIDIWAQATDKNRRGNDGGYCLNGSQAETAPKENRRATTPSHDGRLWCQRIRSPDQTIGRYAGIDGKAVGEIIETPFTANFREGLTVLQYFISTHGARKGLADTALKTANSGYLTRRLVDVAQDCIITEEDCGTIDGIHVSALMEGGEIIETAGERVLGRVALEDITDPFTGETIVEANQQIDVGPGEKIDGAGFERVGIRSVLTCKSKHGVCAMCYGRIWLTAIWLTSGRPWGSLPPSPSVNPVRS